MILRDYVNERLDEGETNTVILGLQNNVNCNLTDALNHVPANHVPAEDWEAEISQRQKETNGQTLIWLADRSDPGYSIQD